MTSGEDEASRAHEPAQGRGSRWILALAVLLGLLLFRGHSEAHFLDADAFDYAHMGRELARGHGFATRQVFPRHLMYFQEHGLLEREPWPNLYRYPLPVVLQGLLSPLQPDPVRVAILRSSLGFLVGALLAFAILRRFLAWPVALAGTAWVVSDLDLWRDAYSGMVESQAAALALVIAWCVTADAGRRRTAAGLGLAVAALYLTKNQYAPLALGVPLLMFPRVPRGKRLRAAAVYGVALGLSLAPWLVRNAALTGDPGFSFSMTRNLVLATQAQPLDVEMRIDEPSEAGALLERHGDGVRAKFLAGMGHALRGHLVVGSAWHSWLAILLLVLTPFLFLGPAPLRAPPEVRSLALYALGLVGLLVLAIALSFPVERFGYPVRAPLIVALLVPLCLATGAGALRPPGACAWGWALLLGGAALHGVLGDGDGLGIDASLERGELERVAELTPPDSLIASDVSYAVALLADRRSLRLPAEPGDLFELSQRALPVDFVHLSAAIPIDGRRTKPPRGTFVRYPHYGAFARGEAFRERYQLVELLPAGGRLYSRRADGP